MEKNSPITLTRVPTAVSAIPTRRNVEIIIANSIAHSWVDTSICGASSQSIYVTSRSGVALVISNNPFGVCGDIAAKRKFETIR
jgi:hypothetical protein